MLSLVLGLTRGLSTGFASILSAAAAVVASLVLFSTWNGLIDNPRVERAARAEYVRIAEFERVAAERDTAKKLLALEVKVTQHLQKQVAGFNDAKTQFELDVVTANSQTQELQNELKELAVDGQGDVPSLDDLGITERLRNR